MVNGIEMKVARTRKDWTQRDLAEALGVHPSEISRIETMGWTPPPAFQQRIADALEVPVETLFPTQPVEAR